MKDFHSWISDMENSIVDMSEIKKEQPTTQQDFQIIPEIKLRPTVYNFDDIYKEHLLDKASGGPKYWPDYLKSKKLKYDPESIGIVDDLN